MLNPLALSSGDLILDRRFGYATAMLGAGDAAAARDILEGIVAEAPDWLAAHHALAKAALGAGDLDRAQAAVRACLRIDPADRLGATLLLAGHGTGGAAAEMSAAFVGELFDRYAASFDRHLVNDLKYDAPAQIHALALALRPAGRFHRALDLGCGTGLAGAALRPLVDHLAGVDLSAGMVARARDKGHYDRLEVGDIVACLAAQAPASADLIVAADVLVYIRDLAPVFGATRRVLRPGGYFIFTTQAMTPAAADAAPVPDAVLGTDMRFAHRDGYLVDLAAACGFDIEHFAAVTTREDAGQPVPGRLLALAVGNGERAPPA